nr:protein SABRE isoform X1 [Ipomoea batatas]
MLAGDIEEARTTVDMSTARPHDYESAYASTLTRSKALTSSLCTLFASGLIAWILSRVLGASVGFRVAGWKCLRDVVVKFKKGAVESISIGEIRLSLRKSLVKLGVGFLSRDPKLQVLISDLEIVMRNSSKSSRPSQKTRSRSSQRTRKSGRGKWMVVANMARFLSVSVTELAIRTPKAAVEVKELTLDISKDGGSKAALFVKLSLVPVLVHLGDTRISYDQSSVYGEPVPLQQTLLSVTERTSAPFICEEFSVMCEFGHEREVGVVVKDVDLRSGEVFVNLNEELLLKRKSAAEDVFQAQEVMGTLEAGAAEKPQKKPAVLGISKYASMLPEKLSFNLPKLDMKFVHRGEGLMVENNIMGIQLKGSKSRSIEDVGESTRLDLQMEFSEIHLLREAGISVMEILKLDVVSSVHIPRQPTSPIGLEVEVKLGGTQSNLILTRLTPWMGLLALRKKKVVVENGGSTSESPKSSGHKAIMWTCTVSAPEMTIVLYDMSGSPLYHGCSQSSHVFANNISSTGTTVHMELGEFNLHMSDEYQECLNESLFGVETNTESLMHVAKISVDWGRKDTDLPEDGINCKLVLSVDVTGMGVFMNFRRLESLISAALSFKSLIRSLSASSKKPAHNRSTKLSKPSGKGIQLIRFNLERCSLNFSGDAGLENAVVADPKRVNYGSHGGVVLINVSADGTPRTASIQSTASDELKKLKYSVSLDVSHLSICINKEKQYTQMELERARSIYQEFLEENNPGTEVTLLDLQNAKFVRRSGGLKDIAVCSLFSATDITFRWEPDLHIALFELGLQLKLMVHQHKLQESRKEVMNDNELKKEKSAESVELVKQHKKRESIFAIDVEMLNISAEVGDGVETTIQVQSIFSENARIGVLLEGLTLHFNNARIFRSSRMQISRIPYASSIASNSKTERGTEWDWVIQALDVHICMPYRLQLRAIDDSVEEMIRALKLITSAKTKLLFPNKEDNPKPKKSRSSKVGRVRFCIRELTAYIEEEPIQGWLDEHYQLLKNEASELAVRLNFLDELVSRSGPSSGATEQNASLLEGKFLFNGEEIDVQDTSAVQKLREEIYRKSFRSYYQACKNLKPSQGSGACSEGFQAGFTPSTSRTSLFSVCATELDVSLTRIEGGETGMIELLQKLDPVCQAQSIPFSRLYGSNINLRAGSLTVRIRNYTCPLFAATSGKCEGRLVLAQQATCFQPQVLKNVFIGRWRKVSLLRSASGTTPPMKTYSDLPLYFKKAEVSYGVGFEPSFTDISYAFTVALRRANLSTRDPNPDPPPPKKEKSLPWWDEMRNYMHGNITLYFSEAKWTVLATTDPYEMSDKLQIISGYMELQQSDGRVYVSAKDFKIIISSLESILKNSSVKHPTGFSCTLIEAPVFSVEVTMEWECDSGNSLNHYLFALPKELVPREKVYDPFRSTVLSLRWNLLLRPALPPCYGQSELSSMCDQHVLDGAAYGSNTPSIDFPTLNLGPHDLAWLIKFWNLNYAPPQKIRSFSRWPRFGVPRAPRSGNLSLDKGLDLHMPKAFINREDCTSVSQAVQMTRKTSQSGSMERARNVKSSSMVSGSTERHRDDGFLLSSDYFTIRRQSPKADPERLLAWQESDRRNVEVTYVRSEFENDSESDDHARSELSDDDGYNVVIADNCQRIFVYGLKLLWTIENRDAVWSWVGGLSKAFQPPKPSPSRQYAHRKLLEENKMADKSEMSQDDNRKSPPSHGVNSSSPQHSGASGSQLRSSPSNSVKVEASFFNESAKFGSTDESEGEGTRHFMVNVIEPQFNLHSEDANGRFLLAAVSGRVLARSFHSVLHIGHEIIEQALGGGNVQIPESQPELTWNRMEFTMMLEHVQAHVAPTDVDPGAGLQWLPKIRKSSPKVKRTGALLERVFMPCDMYFRYTRYKGGTPDLKVKPLKELSFNSHNITATMTSRQFQVMLDVLTNLLFARLPKKLSLCNDVSAEVYSEKDRDPWMVTGGRSILVKKLKKELISAQKSRKAASASLRMALQKAAQQRLTEKEKNKSPSCAMHISLQINKVVWSMLVDGKSFAEAEINDMIYDFDRDYKDVGVARFTTKYFVVRNCLPNAKSDMLLSAWNPPPEWGKKVMLRVDAKQGAPKDGNCPLELFQVDIYPLKIHLTETMYRMMWEYFFPEEEQDSQRRQEVWISTTAGSRRAKKGSSAYEVPVSSSHLAKDSQVLYKSNTSVLPITCGTSQSSSADASEASKLQNLNTNIVSGATSQLRRTSSFDRTWEETVAESVANELVLKAHCPDASSAKCEPLASMEQPDEASRNKSKDSKLIKSGRSSHEEKKVGKANDEKRSRPRRMREFHNIKISQVELLVTYEGSRFAVSDLRLLMDTFHRPEFTGTWRKLFSRVKKHIIWGVLKSVTGMQGKKFKDKAHSQKEAGATGVPNIDINLSDSDGGSAEKSEQYPLTWPKRSSDGAGDRFVTSVRGLFNSQRRKARNFVLRTMRGEAENDVHGGEWSDSEAEFPPFARQLTITKAKKLIRRHTKKFRTRGQKGLSSSQQKESVPSSPRDTPFCSDFSSGSSPYEDFNE